MHDIPGDPDLENPDDEELDDANETISSRLNSIRRNEAPMYVRPYLEDAVWLQPNDDEI